MPLTEGQFGTYVRLASHFTAAKSPSSDEKKILTDACKVFALKKEKIGLVNGEIYNIKLNDTYDLKIANAILMERGNK